MSKEYIVLAESYKKSLSWQKFRIKIVFYICLNFDWRIKVIIGVEDSHYLVATERENIY